jgi:hypothetical protein
MLALDVFEDGSGYFSIRLNPYLGFWGRVKAAIMYVFRQGKAEDNCVSVCLTSNDAKRMVSLLSEVSLENSHGS